MKSRVVHLAVRVPDVDEAAAFYKATFGLTEVCRLDVKNLTAVHLTDGGIYFSVVQYHSDETAESRVGADPCIHHIGIEVDQPDGLRRRIAAGGCTMVSPAEELPIKFLTPDGVLLEIAPFGYFRERLGPVEA